MTDNSENLADFWKEQLETSVNPAEVLMNMYKSIVKDGVNYQTTFRRLVKIYGRKNVYFAVLDCADMPDVEGDPLRLLSYFCKKKIDSKSNSSEVIDIEEIEKKINKMNKGKISEL